MDILFERTKANILCYCIEDWTPLYFVSGFVEQCYKYDNFQLIKKKSLEIIKNLLDEELVKAGDLTIENKFIPWEIATTQTLTKIVYEWDNLGRKLIPHEIVWFDITEKGKKEFQYLNSLPELQETSPFYFDDN